MNNIDKFADIDDYEIEDECRERSIWFDELEDYDDYEIRNECVRRGLGVYEDMEKFCVDVVNNINQGKNVSNDIKTILEKITGKLITGVIC